MKKISVAAEVMRLKILEGLQDTPVRASLPRLLRCCGLAIALLVFAEARGGEAKKIVLVAGRPSHGPAQHEHRAGCLLLKACLDKVPGFSSVVYSNGWPTDPTAFEGAAIAAGNVTLAPTTITFLTVPTAGNSVCR